MLRTRFRTRARFIPALSGGGAFSITNSLRFNDNDSAYLSRTPSVAGDTGLWTWSGWVKLGNLNTNRALFSAGASSGNSTIIYLTTNNNLFFLAERSGAQKASVYTNASLRDVSGWYHVVVSLDTAETNKVSVYINGELQTLVTNTSPSAVDSDYLINGNIMKC